MYVLQAYPRDTSVLTAAQKEALQFAYKMSKMSSQKCFNALCARVARLGYTNKDLQK